MDKLPEKKTGRKKYWTGFFWEEILGTLEAKERRLIYMRYFQNMTQMEIAHEAYPRYRYPEWKEDPAQSAGIRREKIREP